MEGQQAKGCIATCLQQFQIYNWQIKEESKGFTWY
jgi:hypothetical protein